MSVMKTFLTKMEHVKFWQEFFQLYRELPALWRVKSTEYTDRVLKSKCYMKLVRKLRELYPDADREMVVRKINNYRTSYRKELRRMKQNEKNGKKYKPTLWYFDSLSFLHDQDDSVVAEHSIYEEENAEEKKQTSQDDVNIDTITCNRPNKRVRDSKNNEEEVDALPNTSKRKRITKLLRKKQLRQLSYEGQQQAKIDADIVAKSWAVQYKELQGNQKLIARKLVSDILFYGCLGTLNMSHVIDFQEILLHKQANVSQPQSPTESNGAFQFAEQECDDSVRESTLEFNSCSPSLSPATNVVSKLNTNEIKLEVP